MEWLGALAPAEEIYTADWLVHQRRSLPRRGRPFWLVAVEGNEVIGLGRDVLEVFDGGPGRRRTWVGVRPDRRGQGVGTMVWTAIEAHACSAGGSDLVTWSIADEPAGGRFASARGFVPARRMLQSFVDPTTVNFADLEQRKKAAEANGFLVCRLQEVLFMQRALRRLFLSADAAAPGHRPGPPVAASTFRRVILENPLLDPLCSTVVVHGEQPVALCWLKGDRSAGRYAVEFTGTAPAWRGRGLATLAKLAALHEAARVQVRSVGTANAEDNAPMLAINRRLGHRPLADLIEYERPGRSLPSS